MTLLFREPTEDQGASRKSQKHSQKALENAKIISALANKFELRIKPTQSKAGRPKNELTESGKEWVKNFLDKPDITYVTPGRKDHRYVEKVDGKNQ